MPHVPPDAYRLDRGEIRNGVTTVHKDVQRHQATHRFAVRRSSCGSASGNASSSSAFANRENVIGNQVPSCPKSRALAPIPLIRSTKPV
jgi:hypothetical protein